VSRLACSVCATPAVPGARFCFNCGAPLERPAEFGDGSAERRLVTVLFGDLSDFTAWAEDLDPERVGGVTDRVLAELAAAVTAVGGHVDKLTGDGIMAVFGAPTMHEDDPERAVRAAAQMQASLRRLMEQEVGGGRRMGLRVGLNTGEVLAGVQANMAYTVVGDTVNTASRLADAAAIGSVYAGRETALATMSIASWRALTPLRLKGKREPVPAYELLGLRPPGAVRLGVGEEAPFVGRDAELGALIGRLLDVEQRARPATVVVTGEAGVGKTRLAAELARFTTQAPNQWVLWGRCTPYGTGRALAPIAEWVRTACGIAEDESEEQAADRVRRTLARLERPTYRHPLPANVVEWLLSLLGLTASMPAPRETAAPGTTSEGTDPLLDAVLALLDGLSASGPLLLIVDDLQWGTPELVAALTTLMQRLAGPVLLVCLGRSDVLADGDLPDDWWTGLPDPELLPVTPLDDAASSRLLRAYLDGGELDSAAQSLLIERAQGHPFFLAELLHLLVDRGVLRSTDDGWRLQSQLPTEMLPAGVQSVLAARFDGLDPVSKAVLRDAAVVGTRFAASTLVAIDPRPDEEIEFALQGLDARGIITQLSDGDGPTAYTFAHTLARDVVYAAIPKAERARRHAIVATWAAGSMRGPRGEVDAFVAAHAERAAELADEMQLPADDPAWQARQSGFAALTRLGQAAIYRGDNGRAEVVFTRALLVGGDGVPEDGRLPALTGRASARVALHRLVDAEVDLEAPLQARDFGVRAAALVVLGEIRRQRGEDDAARQALVSALTMASDAGVDRVTGEALRQLGMIDYQAGRLQSAEQRFREALQLAERVGDDHGAGWAYQHWAWSATTRGDWAVAETTLARAGELFASLDDGSGLSWCAGTEAFVRLLQGRYHEARQLAQGLLPLGKAMGEPWGVAACQTIDAFAAAELGDIEAARAGARAAYDGFVALSDTWGRAMALTAWGAAERGAGRPRKAIDVLEDAVDCSAQAQHATTEALSLGVLGYCRLDRGDSAGAEKDARRALERLQGMDLEPPAFVGPKVLLAQALRAQGRLDEALSLLEEAAASTDAPSLIFPRRQALAHCAGALLEAGRDREALGMIGKAFEVEAEDMRSRIVALRVLGNCYLAAGDVPAARYALRQALALARSSQQVSEVAATERTAKAVGL
jgi:class 3 adenylate cyclase/tetratricopeptide (TPR) repeat protein